MMLVVRLRRGFRINLSDIEMDVLREELDAGLAD
jgi:hypothetical protein